MGETMQYSCITFAYKDLKTNCLSTLDVTDEAKLWDFEGRGLRLEGRGVKEEGRGVKEEGRGVKEEGRGEVIGQKKVPTSNIQHPTSDI